MTIHKSILAILLLAVAAGAAAVLADEDATYTRTDMPEAVLAAFAADHPDVTPTGYDIEAKDDTRQFEVETKSGRFGVDYIYLADGTLIQKEEQIANETLPAVIVAAAMKTHPKCELDEAERITRGTTVEYEVIVEVGEDHEYELLIAADGTVLKNQSTDDDESEDDADLDDDQDELDDD